MCARCDRLNTTCVYPEPPDRRGPRKKRMQRLLHRTANHSRDDVYSGHTTIQHPRTESISQETSPIREQISGSHPSHHNEENAATPSRAGTDDISATLVAKTPVLSDVGIQTSR